MSNKTIREAELEQRTADYISYVRDFAENTSKDVRIKSKREGFTFSLFDKDCTLEFSI